MQSNTLVEHEIVTGTVNPKPNDPKNTNVIVVSFVKRIVQHTLQLKKRGVTKFTYPIAVHYSKPTKAQKLKETIEDTENKALDAMKKVLLKLQTQADSFVMSNTYRQEHINVWNDLWATGFTISTSKADNSLNGDRINATMYAVLSQVRSYEFEEMVSLSAPSKQEIAKALTYAEGCYDSYHTLQAENLWLVMDSLEHLNNLVSSWMLTLEKQVSLFS